MLLIKEKPPLLADAEQMHLCYLGDDGCQAEYRRIDRKLTRHPTYICKHCGRKAHDVCNLCRSEPTDFF